MSEPSPPSARAAGILVHPTSLPGAHGCGDLGDGATELLDYFHTAGLQVWQILPLGPTGFGNSPYAARSAFAGNPLLLSLDRLCALGLLTPADLAGAPAFDPDCVAFEAAGAYKLDRLRLAFARLEAQPQQLRAEVAAFTEENSGWLDDFALFMALRGVYAGKPWTEWEAPVRERLPEALASARDKLSQELAFHGFLQYLFDRQWSAVKALARERGIRIMGDLPIFVAHDSSDVWANSEIFTLSADGEPAVVAGVPPDYFSATGQRWGNPLYRWDVLAQQGYHWWIERFRRLLHAVDVVRIDHFRGFEQYWEIPGKNETAEQGRWVAGPGLDLFTAVRAALGSLPLVAEDLGLVTPAVEALRRALGIPGMRVLQFAFGGDATNPYLPHNYEAKTVVYTGTHDNDTTAGWFAALPEAQRGEVREYLACDGDDIAHDFIRLAYASVADLAMVPLQDVLSLGSEGRMNVPGRPEANWTWRYRAGALTNESAAWLARLTCLYGRAK